ncbi:hypothetical protein HYS72_02750 [Candidatus Pacearchaeota archaeon]|nr:hypothetical protein [Candidatus Pacearchaeota archaeon]
MTTLNVARQILIQKQFINYSFRDWELGGATSREKNKNCKSSKSKISI